MKKTDRNNSLALNRRQFLRGTAKFAGATALLAGLPPGWMGRVYANDAPERADLKFGIARAFALSPKMLLLDEPFGMLDSLTRFELQQVLIELWRKDQKTALMVTHDVDEALFLSDRIVMMTNGPEAEVGDVLEVNFPRPRERKAVMEHPDYYKLREHLIEFLEVHAYRGQPHGGHEPSTPAAPKPQAPSVTEPEPEPEPAGAPS